MKTIILTFLFAPILLCINTQNLPTGATCTCPTRNFANHVFNSPLIFSGRVANIASGDNTNRISFYINTLFKGRTKTNRIIINTPKTANACGFNFLRGNDYLVYTSYDANRNLIISSCSRTMSLDNSCNDLIALSRLNFPTIPSIPIRPNTPTA